MESAEYGLRIFFVPHSELRVPHSNPFSAISIASCANLLYRNSEVIVEPSHSRA